LPVVVDVGLNDSFAVVGTSVVAMAVGVYVVTRVVGSPVVRKVVGGSVGLDVGDFVGVRDDSSDGLSDGPPEDFVVVAFAVGA